MIRRALGWPIALAAVLTFAVLCALAFAYDAVTGHELWGEVKA